MNVLKSDFSIIEGYSRKLNNSSGQFVGLSEIDLVEDDNTPVQLQCHSMYEEGREVLCDYLNQVTEDSKRLLEIGVVLEEADNDIAVSLEGKNVE